MKLAAIFSLISAIIYIILQGLHPAYYSHLYPDVFAFFARASHFWDNGSLTNLGHNEYQPGAIVFFITLSPVFLIEKSVDFFKWALFTANTLFIFLIGFLFIKMKKTEGVFLMSIFIVFLGPILLFRFDLLVILLTVLCFYFWEKDAKALSMVILAFAVITKIYPLIFLPYLLFQSFRTGKKLNPPYYFLIFTSAFLAFLLLYTYFFRISLNDTWVSYNYHNLKSVATESVWASLIYSRHFLSGQSLPGMESAYGINAIDRDEVFPSIQFYNYFWILPLGLIYFIYLLRNRNWERIDYKFLSFILLIFLIFSKVVSNQYLSWFLFMLPLIEVSNLLKREWIINLFLTVLTVILHTFIYPLNYSSWLSSLNGGDFDVILFLTVIFSNFVLIILGLRIGINVFKTHNRH